MYCVTSYRYAAVPESFPRHYQSHISRLMSRREQWAHAYRTLPVHTSCVVRSAFEVVDQYILGRARAFNMVPLLEFICVRMESNYVSKLMSVVNGSVLLKTSKLPDGVDQVRIVLAWLILQVSRVSRY